MTLLMKVSKKAKKYLENKKRKETSLAQGTTKLFLADTIQAISKPDDYFKTLQANNCHQYCNYKTCPAETRRNKTFSRQTKAEEINCHSP